MKGYRFYAEYDSPVHKRRDTMPHGRSSLASTNDPARNVVAVCLEWKNGSWGIDWTIPRTGQGAVADAVSGVLDEPNSCVAYTAVGIEYLRKNCRRISESEARRIHPALFEYLEYEPEE